MNKKSFLYYFSLFLIIVVTILFFVLVKNKHLIPLKIRLAFSPLKNFLEEKNLIEDNDLYSRHQYFVKYLHQALKKKNFKEASALNAYFAHKAFLQSYKNLKAWEKLRDPISGLVPKGLGYQMSYWNTKDTAADLFPFLLMASKLLDESNQKLWLTTLKNERKISGPMPRSINLKNKKLIEEEIDDVIYGASEYAKDGLLAVSEFFGYGPWFERLEEIMQTLIKNAPVQTKRGKICSENSEVNGEMLQVLTRLYWATRKKEYLEMAERIGEVYFFDILPKTGFLPPSFWDFSEEKPRELLCRLRDHGCEIIPGLAELYFLEKKLGSPKADLYKPPIKKLLDLFLTKGRNKYNLWCKTIDINTSQILDRKIIDNWGYILNAYQTFDLAENTSIYKKEIEKYLKKVASIKNYKWEGISHDGQADTIESMLYFLPWFDIPKCHRWVDEEIENMLRKQTPSGFIGSDIEQTERGYLDGNFIRTALLYAFYKTQGVMVSPWREDVYFGSAYDKKNKKLYVYLKAYSNWEGFLKFDIPRHKIFWNLPINYPRINACPEWFTVDPEKIYTVLDLRTGKDTDFSGKILKEGLKLTIDEGQVPFYYLVIFEKEKD